MRQRDKISGKTQKVDIKFGNLHENDYLRKQNLE